jgi:hypothetical protein
VLLRLEECEVATGFPGDGSTFEKGCCRPEIQRSPRYRYNKKHFKIELFLAAISCKQQALAAEEEMLKLFTYGLKKENTSGCSFSLNNVASINAIHSSICLSGRVIDSWPYRPNLPCGGLDEYEATVSFFSAAAYQ